MSSTGEPGKPGKQGGPGWGGAGGEGGRGGVGEDPGGRGGPGGSGGAGGDLGDSPAGYAAGRRWFRLLVMTSLILASFSVFMSAWLYVRVNDERARNVERNCSDVNARHDAALEGLDIVLGRARVGASPERLRQIEQSRASTLLLIQALTPKRDCAALAARQVNQ